MHCRLDGFKKVLVVDDDPVEVEFLSSLLAPLGCEVLKAHGGAEAIDLVLSDEPDFIILDLMMPEVSGWDVLREIRRLEHGWKIPVLVYTGAELTSDERKQLAGSVQAVVLKGGGKSELWSEMKRIAG